MAPTPLEIKVNALKRLIKEESLYNQETAEQASLVDQMRTNNADPYELKKQVEVLNESKRMVVELTKKIDSHSKSLAEFLKGYSGDEDLTLASSLLK
ncbi:tubulin folding cofactor A [Yamadazyma tenuis]|uniref:Tubulin-specific chaperone A n=1 Tax=Candida tenuis (strain ATCC 10573 / BCRC 21748 / CBS 615 / JCM 9827 / NBRC 10315 / NRRL Y-1498 / VKM Y-70) TaxID=590646 RepID=G3B3Z1_CANTC|nr:tubulin binding cofactor A [Yamadazyma tenuis ATCC 10573]EGV63897.1 tubulin binding cofactor A [Yamadazyma tenuis ATCC 10573]WEJ96485.1 tubulin folding cofactor A [Yamadazyma tenuis]